MANPSDIDRPGEGSGYERFFGFAEAPFSLAPNPRFLFESTSHSAALSQVAYAIERREPLVVITGEVGTGKTLLCRTVLQRVPRKTFVSVINDPLLDRDDLLKQLLEDFGVISRDRTRMAPATRHELVHALEEFLASLISLQAHAVVIVDEAQHLQPDVLEQIRLLSNVDDDRGTMLQIILVGQTDLDPILARPELRQFQQRVTRRFRLERLNRHEVVRYIEHRTFVARGNDARALQLPPVFTREAMEAVAALSGGLPRVINVICDRALELAHAQQSLTVDLFLVNAAARALNLQAPPMPAPAISEAQPPPPPIAPPGRPFDDLDAVDDSVDLNALDAVDAIPVSFDAAFDAPHPAGSASNNRRALILVAVPVAAAIAIWFGASAVNRMTDPAASAPTIDPAPAPEPGPAESPSAPAATAPPAAAAATAPPAAAAATAPPAAAAPVAAPPTARGATPGRTAPASSPSGSAAVPSATQAGTATAPTTGERFEIIVASFRTEARAAGVAGDVQAMGVPVRQRVIGGWQQVLAGPFSSRAEAESAQTRLAKGGLNGTQIVVSAR